MSAIHQNRQCSQPPQSDNVTLARRNKRDKDKSSSDSVLQAVILAAGMGTRLGRSLPKPLTVLGDGRSILHQQLDHLRAVLGAGTEITLVVGYQAETIMKAASGARFVHNPAFATTNTSKSLWYALTASQPGGVLWLNGDVVFDPAILQHALPALRDDQSFVCVDTATVGEEEVKYTLDADGYIKHLSKSVVGGRGEAIGINYVSASDKQTLIEHLEACDDQDYFERAMETAIAGTGLRFRALEISIYAAVEVDFEEDLVRANMRCLQNGITTPKVSPCLVPAISDMAALGRRSDSEPSSRPTGKS
jgi:choline kinase